MSNYITIDGGTTNTRINLVSDYKIIDTVKFNIGARVGSHNHSALADAVKDGIAKILARNSMDESDVVRILASGMITSEGGLCNLEHLVAPCGIDELSAGMYETLIEEISSVPFVFGRGVKLGGNTFDTVDMMRGEETELMGLGENLDANCLYVLPGSHSKHILTDSKGRISDFSTQLTGELLAAVCEGTILKNSVCLDGVSVDEDYLYMGYEYAIKKGVNSAFFKVRILDKLFSCSKDEVFSFFLGSALSAEIENIIKSDSEKVVICGKKELKTPTAMLVRKYSSKQVEEIDEEISSNATAYGIIRIYENI